ALDLLALTRDVALVLGLDLDLRRDFRVYRCARAGELRERCVPQAWPLEEIHERVVPLDGTSENALGDLDRHRLRADPGGLQPVLFARDRVALAIERVPARIVDHA